MFTSLNPLCDIKAQLLLSYSIRQPTRETHVLRSVPRSAVMVLQGLPVLSGWSANSGRPSHRYRHWWPRIISQCFHTAKHSLAPTNTHMHTCSSTNTQWRHTDTHRKTCKRKTHTVLLHSEAVKCQKCHC